MAVKHIIAFDMAHVAHVTNISECKVVVEAPLAAPVTHSPGVWFLFCYHLSWCHFLHNFSQRIFIFNGNLHMSWHSFRIFIAFGLFAPVAFFAAFEVVVLALAALPASFRELEVSFRW